jgi:hypothetical protein
MTARNQRLNALQRYTRMAVAAQREQCRTLSAGACDAFAVRIADG